MEKFNVLFWNFNSDKLEYYDVLPYFRNCYQEHVTNFKKYGSDYWKVPNTIEELKDFIERKSSWRFWSRCEYELILCGWPVRKNEHKLDIHEQIMMNINVITNILWNELVGNK